MFSKIKMLYPRINNDKKDLSIKQIVETYFTFYKTNNWKILSASATLCRMADPRQPPCLRIRLQDYKIVPFGNPDGCTFDIVIVSDQNQVIPFHSDDPNAAIVMASVGGAPTPYLISIKEITGDVTINHNETYWRCGCGQPGCNVPAAQ